MRHTVWTILKDHIADKDAPHASNANAFTLCGPAGAAKIFAHEWNNHSAGPLMLSGMIAGHAEARDFRMFDDDGELYYEGRILIGDEIEAELMPLDNFGTPNAGCTEIRIKNKDGKWETV